MTVTAGDVIALASLAVTLLGIFVYLGRQLSTLKMIAEGQKVLFDRTEGHAKDITAIKVDVAEVKTRQKDCEHCP